MPYVSIKDLNITFSSGKKTIKAVNNVSLNIEKRESIGIVGESGSGKSTLAMGILQLLANNAQMEGEIFLEDEDLLKMNEKRLKQIRWEKLAVVFQRSMNALSPVHRIGSQMEDIFRLHDSKTSKTDMKKRIIQTLKRVNLPERVYRMYPHELSGGMMQRVSIALSLIHNPDLLILDEATTALDVVTERQILEELKVLEEELHLTKIMITHDMSVVATSCDKVAVMYAGNVLEVGRVSEVLPRPLHPYTEGLLNSFVSAKNKSEELKGIPGSLPDLSEEQTGCVFADRCPIAEEYCFKHIPAMQEVEKDRSVACHKVGGDLDERTSSGSGNKELKKMV